MQLYTRQLADFLAQPPVSRQPSPRQGRLESSSVEPSAGGELDTVSQGQEGGTSAGVRWVTRDQASRVMQVETVETLLAFHIQQLESSRTFYTHSTHFI